MLMLSSGAHTTHRWREMDSNSRSPVSGDTPQRPLITRRWATHECRSGGHIYSATSPHGPDRGSRRLRAVSRGANGQDMQQQGRRNIKLLPGTLPIKGRMLFGIEVIGIECSHMRQQGLGGAAAFDLV